MANNSQNLSDDTNNMLSANSNLNDGHITLAANIQIGRVNLQRRTAEGSRLLRENFQTVIQEFRPFVEQARTVNQSGISLSTLLNRQQSRTDNPSSPSVLRDSYVINLGDSNQGQISGHQLLNNENGTHIHNHGTDNMLSNIRETTASIEHNTNNNNNNNPEETNPAEALRQVPEARALLEILQRYVPFLLILLGKGLYDHGNGILNFIVLFVAFSHSNSIVKREACKQHRRSLTSLLLQVFYIFCGIFFIAYILQDGFHLFSNLIFIPSYTQPSNMWDIIWTVGVTDFMLKLITILFKIVIVAIPAQLLPYQKRGKFYLLTEATSQLYRSIVPIQPWLYYFLESYQGPEKIASVVLSAAYMVSKGSDLVARMRLFKTAVYKAFQNVTLGTSPNKEQLQSAGNLCPICHDDYDTPVLLQCKHIFCESCVSTWFDREQTCPLCRAKVVDDPSWRDGSTTYFTQLF